MRIRPWLLLVGTLLLQSLDAAPTPPAAYVARHHYGAKFEVPDRVIHGAGQSDEIEFANYVQVIGAAQHPRMYMAYTSTARVVADQEARVEGWRRILDTYPDDVMLQVGLSFTSSGVGYEDQVNSGAHDANIQALTVALESLGRPVLVRIGYEANGFWNGYTAAKYVTAFQRIATLMRTNTENIATVWCTHPVDSLSKMLTYYPGDAYVDWWSIDLFENKYINPAQTASKPTFDFLAEAHRRNRPVIIGESTPHSIGVLNGETSWNQWFAYYFNLIRTQPGIKGFCYINRFWSNYAEWSTWGDARLESNATVAQLFRTELQQSFYLHARDPGRKVTRVLTVEADTYAESGARAGDALGVLDPLQIRAGVADVTREAFLRFDLSAFSQVEDATLWALTEGSLSADAQAELHWVSDNSWSESGLTWNNRPTMGGPVATLEIRRVNSPRLRGVDLRDAVRSAAQAGHERLSLGIRYLPTGSATAKIHSRERSPGHPVQLVVHGWLRESLGEWQERHGLQAVDPSEDSDGDGFQDGWEYYAGTNPLLRDEHLPIAVTSGAAGGMPTVRYLRGRHLPADPFTAEVSGNLSQWDPAPAAEVVDADPLGDGAAEAVEVSGLADPAWFFRLQVPAQ